MKKAIFGVVLFVVVSVVYLFLSDFSLVKKLIGYNIPQLKEPKTVSENGGELSFLDIPEGFEISVVAKDLDNPRVILFDAKGRMLVSETKAGKVSILDPVKSQGDHGARGGFENKRVLIEGLKSPHGLDFYPSASTSAVSSVPNGSGQVSSTGIIYLYIAETQQVVRYRYDVNAGKLVDIAGEQITKLPDGGQPASPAGGHFTRTIAFGPNFRTSQIIKGLKVVNTQVDTKLYISVGSSCDVCEESTWKRAAILESDPEGSYTAEFAGGLRNSVFFVFHPVTKEIWATEMGRDNLGDNLPPDEINIVKVAGPEHKFGARRYGWPFCYGDKVTDKKFNPDKFERIDIPRNCAETEPPVIEIPAHSAPLGLAFIPPGRSWPKEWEGDLLVALHGSWNRSEPAGYKVVRYDLDKNGKVLSQEPFDFISGWLSTSNQQPVTSNQIYGRPVDLKFNNDGNLYISDDAAGLIYKVEVSPFSGTI
ncbi:MAG: PQQ-dependent sugar dehydrogenase [Candidatus Yanofskybacteria bacterium]|nr:PQQ-dependent sugar dehydrogenase [Candidatus Yanofskybacteria bacterium]